MGLKTIDQLGRSISYWDTLEGLKARRSEFEELLGGPTPLLDVLFKLVEGLLGCPRHLGLHNGGMVLTREPLAGCERAVAEEVFRQVVLLSIVAHGLSASPDIAWYAGGAQDLR